MKVAPQRFGSIKMTILPSTAATSTAHRVLQSRAVQCSFSSVFHLRRAGMDPKESKFIEQLFITCVGLPLALLGAAGGVRMLGWKQSDVQK